ncbi:DNA recombination protein RmuC [Dubosiella newyorkensis]|jgi:DNA recombination protein RmuC|uniref:DNA recombination protein RmuC n=2 Tax=Dubosiella newyorkensis TaxID=1862672 RepID=UPI002357D60E|nr:DNA recombination protein RmuC [Dubosiella newyorkensis]MCI9041817.1 DNA recombination protein RmuC [Dubosiella newyorkensis]
MNLFILFLLILILLSLLFLIFYIMMQHRNEQERSLLERQETKNTNAQFDSILNQMQHLQKNQIHSLDAMDWVQRQVDQMANVMTNTKRRGSWGEYQLDYILSTYLGENDSIYSTQYTLPNGKIADVALHLPGRKQVLCIDSKFPMENYARMDDEENKEYYARQFIQNVKKHVDDIANKYINHATAPQALMFIPSEAIYQFICASCDFLFSYALQRHVLITSPTTLVGILFSLQASTNDFYRATHLEKIEHDLWMLKEDVRRLQERAIKANQAVETAAKQLQQVQTSSKKIASRFEGMMEGKEYHDIND